MSSDPTSQVNLTPLAPEPPDTVKLTTDERRFDLEGRRAHAEISLRNEELKLTERDVASKEEANKRRDPILIALVVAALGLFGNIFVTWYIQHSAHIMAVERAKADADLARQKADSDLVLEATKSPDYDTRVNNLKSILALGLVADPSTEARLKNGLDSGLIPNNSSSASSRPSTPTGYGTGGYGTGPYGGVSSGAKDGTTSSSTNSADNPQPKRPETLIADKTFTVPNGDYAVSSNPPCSNISIENVATLAREISSDTGKWASLLPKKEGEMQVEINPTNSMSSAGGDIAKLIAPDRRAACAIVTGQTPDKYKSLRIDVSAADSSGNWSSCQVPSGPWLICSIGWAAWSYKVEDHIVVATFKNWSHNRSRAARIQVFGTL